MPAPRPRAWPILPVAAVLAALACHGAATWAWLRANGLPDGFQNEFIHLSFATEVYFRLKSGDLPGLHYFLFEEYYPPLLYLGSAASMALLGPGPDSATAVNIVFLAVIAGSLLAVGTRLRRPAVGVAAAWIALAYPSVFGNARRLEPNLAVAATASVAFALLVASWRFRRRGLAIAFGIICGLGMLADRLSFAFFLVPPAALAVWAEWRTAREPLARRAVVVHTLSVLAAAALVCGYYYGNFMRLHWDEVASQVVAGEVIETGEHTERRPISSPANWAYYGVAWLDSQMGVVLGVACLLACATALRRRTRGDEGLVLAWGLGSTLLFTLVHKKQPFYTVPALPAFALLTALAWDGIRRPAVRWGVAGAVGLLAFQQHAALSGLYRPPLPVDGTGASGALWRVLAGGSPFPSWWADHELTQAGPPRPAPVHLDAARRALGRVGYRPGHDRVFAVSDSPDFPEIFLEPLLRLELGTRDVEGGLLNPEALRENYPSARFLLYVSGDPLRDWPRDQDLIDAMNRWKKWEDDQAFLDAFHTMRTWAVPVVVTGGSGPGAGLWVWDLRQRPTGTGP